MCTIEENIRYDNLSNYKNTNVWYINLLFREYYFALGHRVPFFQNVKSKHELFKTVKIVKTQQFWGISIFEEQTLTWLNLLKIISLLSGIYISDLNLDHYNERIIGYVVVEKENDNNFGIIFRNRENRESTTLWNYFSSEKEIIKNIDLINYLNSEKTIKYTLFSNISTYTFLSQKVIQLNDILELPKCGGEDRYESGGGNECVGGGGGGGGGGMGERNVGGGNLAINKKEEKVSAAVGGGGGGVTPRTKSAENLGEKYDKYIADSLTLNLNKETESIKSSRSTLFMKNFHLEQQTRALCGMHALNNMFATRKNDSNLPWFPTFIYKFENYKFITNTETEAKPGKTINLYAYCALLRIECTKTLNNTSLKEVLKEFDDADARSAFLVAYNQGLKDNNVEQLSPVFAANAAISRNTYDCSKNGNFPLVFLENVLNLMGFKTDCNFKQSGIPLPDENDEKTVGYIINLGGNHYISISKISGTNKIYYWQAIDSVNNTVYQLFDNIIECIHNIEREIFNICRVNTTENLKQSQSSSGGGGSYGGGGGGP